MSLLTLIISKTIRDCIGFLKEMLELHAQAPFPSLPSLSLPPPLPFHPRPFPLPSPPRPLPSPSLRSRPPLLRLGGLGYAQSDNVQFYSLAPPAGPGGARPPNGIW